METKYKIQRKTIRGVSLKYTLLYGNIEEYSECLSSYSLFKIYIIVWKPILSISMIIS